MKDFLEIINDFKISTEERLDAAAKIAKNFKPDLDAVCEVDLHCHSFYSDGYFSPTAKVFEAFRRKMKAIAIADHDVFDGQIEALRAGEIFGIDVIAAAEFYTNRPGVEIIAHFPNKNDFIKRFNSNLFDDLVEPIRKAKKKQLEGMIARIPECFAKFAFKAEIKKEDIDRYVRNGISTKGDISVIMWQKYGQELRRRGLASDVKDFQAKYTTNPQMLDLPLEIDIDLTPEAFVKRILSWGGLPGLSHPTELRRKEGLNNQALNELIEKLGSVGLQTIEVDGWRNGICPETGKNQTELFNEMRLNYNYRHPEKLPLLFTNGSDDHNQPGEGLELGCGKARNLKAEFGKYESIFLLKQRQDLILSKTKVDND